ncbi:hypothetical protein ACFL0L_04185 [Patescibacteria group bacterium]
MKNISDSKKYKRIVLQVLVVFAVIILAWSAVYLLQKEDDEYGENDTYSYDGDFPTITETVGDDTVFTNNEYGYGVTFSKSWTLDPIDNANDVLVYIPWILSAEAETLPDYGMKIQIYVSSVEPELSLSEKVEKDIIQYGEQSVESRREMTLDGRKAEQVELQVFGHTLATYSKRDGNFIVFLGNIFDQTNREQYIVMYQDLLSTLRFLD